MGLLTSQFNIATCLTLSRFILVPVFIYYFLIDSYGLALTILIVASLTDVTDGLLARRFNMGTRLGSFLDPLADKFLMMISFLVLTVRGVIPGWLTILVLGRDFLIVFGALYIHFVRHVQAEVKPTILSKRNTFVQFLLLTLSFIKTYIVRQNPDMPEQLVMAMFRAHTVFVWLAAVLAVATLIQYTLVFFHLLKTHEAALISSGEPNDNKTPPQQIS